MKRRTSGLDNDGVKMNEAMNAALFPTTNYGQQTTIGTVADLRNPSLRAIRAYYYKYYVPNNMAVIMAGDFDPDVLIRKIDSAFSYMRPKPVEGIPAWPGTGPDGADGWDDQWPKRGECTDRVSNARSGYA